MRSQALGLAEAVGLPIEEKRIVVASPLVMASGRALPMPLSALDHGQRSARAALAAARRRLRTAIDRRRACGEARVRSAHLRGLCAESRMGTPPEFDLVAAMPHDGVNGPNVVTVAQTALNVVTPERLAAAREEWRARLAPNGRPVLGVLVGGDNGGYRLTAAVTARLVRILTKAHGEHGLCAAITPSRRTTKLRRERSKPRSPPNISEGCGTRAARTPISASSRLPIG